MQKVIFKELCEQKTYAEVANCHVAKYKSSSYIFSLMYGNSDIFMFNAAFILVLVQDTYYQWQYLKIIIAPLNLVTLLCHWTHVRSCGGNLGVHGGWPKSQRMSDSSQELPEDFVTCWGGLQWEKTTNCPGLELEEGYISSYWGLCGAWHPSDLVWVPADLTSDTSYLRALMGNVVKLLRHSCSYLYSPGNLLASHHLPYVLCFIYYWLF